MFRVNNVQRVMPSPIATPQVKAPLPAKTTRPAPAIAKAVPAKLAVVKAPSLPVKTSAPTTGNDDWEEF
jgi:hypothetical protein